MKELSTFSKRFKVLMHILDKGEVSRTQILDDLNVHDISGNAMNLILKELVSTGFINFKNGTNRGFIYFVRPEFKAYLKDLVAKG